MVHRVVYFCSRLSVAGKVGHKLNATKQYGTPLLSPTCTWPTKLSTLAARATHNSHEYITPCLCNQGSKLSSQTRAVGHRTRFFLSSAYGEVGAPAGGQIPRWDIGNCNSSELSEALKWSERRRPTLLSGFLPLLVPSTKRILICLDFLA